MAEVFIIRESLIRTRRKNHKKEAAPFIKKNGSVICSYCGNTAVADGRTFFVLYNDCSHKPRLHSGNVHLGYCLWCTRAVSSIIKIVMCEIQELNEPEIHTTFLRAVI